MKSGWYSASVAALFVACVFVLGLESSSAGEADAPRSVEPGSVFVRMDYMHLTDSTPQEYLELELGEWRAIQEQRIRRGVTTAWYFYEMMPGARKDGDQPYDYITVSVFPSYDNVFDEAATEAIFDVYPGIDLQEMYARADAARSFVRSDLFKLTRVTSPYTGSKPVSPYLVIDYFDTEGGSGGHIELETDIWAPVHEKRIRRGLLNSAAVLVWTNPDGEEERDYDYAAISYYDTLAQLREPVDAELVRAAHPDKSTEDAARVFERTDEARATYKSQLWRLIDKIEAVSLEDD